MMEWNVSPEILHLGPLQLRWYGLLFAFGFAISFFLGKKVYRKEGYDDSIVDSLLVYTVIGTIIGARLVHCLFYEPDYYLENPISILKVWEGGLASHGAILGLISAGFLFTRKFKDPGFWWTVDMISTVAIVAGAFIRLGNLMNSEIYGKPTNADWGVIFLRLNEPPIARHPAQLYEAILYFILAGMMWLYYKRFRNLGSGKAVGLLLISVFTTRFFVEFVKENQEDFDMGLPINMGQMLSIPFIIFGLILFLRSNHAKSASAR